MSEDERGALGSRLTAKSTVGSRTWEGNVRQGVWDAQVSSGGGV